MARLVLHIGTHKTGTTMIQNRLYQARADLATAGVTYPDLGRHTGHHGYLTDWIALPPAYATPEGGQAGLQALADTWRDTDSTVFLSSEEFSRAGGRGGQPDFDDIKRIFAGYDIRILCVLRSQWQFLQSVYLEISQTTPPPPPGDIASTALRTGQVDGLWCDYLNLYEGLCRHFDPADIRLVDYGTASASTAGLLATVLRHALPKHDLPPLDQTVSHRDNRSPKPIPVWAAHVVAGGPKPGSDLHGAAQEAYDIEYGPDRPGCIFTHGEIRNLTEHFRPSNDRLANRVRNIQPGWQLAPQPLPDTTLYREDITPAYWIRLARRLSLRQRPRAA